MCPTSKPLAGPRILLIRFSSFGDVLQTLSVVRALKIRWPDSEIHWVTRSEYVPVIEKHPDLTKAWGLEKHKGLRGLWELAQALNRESFTRVYDAHNNLRSLLLRTYLVWARVLQAQAPPALVRRSLNRWKRFLLFRFRKNLFEQPFSGQRDLLAPLKTWGIPSTPPPAPQLFLSEESLKGALQKLPIPSPPLGPSLKKAPTPPFPLDAPLDAPLDVPPAAPFTIPFVALAPSAAFPLKRWPLTHWAELLRLWFAQDPHRHFVLLGGAEDTFFKELEIISPKQIHNLAGLLTLSESSAVVAQSALLIANDTGLLHVGEQLGHPTIALMGPAPFGFPCRRDSTEILEIALDCRPCSKHGQGPCRNPKFQQCLQDILPEQVYRTAFKALNRDSSPDPNSRATTLEHHGSKPNR